ncbi:MAG: hypothetical protein P8Y05_11810 [Deinococcales bacterium]
MSDPSPKAVTVVPLLGPLHVRLPQYNAVSVLRSVQAFRPSVVALAPLTQGQLQNPAWQECAELPLPHTVVPWARRTGIPLAEIGATPEDESAEADFRRAPASRSSGPRSWPRRCWTSKGSASRCWLRLTTYPRCWPPSTGAPS